MSSDARIQGHIRKALQFEKHLTGGLPLEWEVVIHYYAALHWVTATVTLLLKNKRLNVPSFNDHQTLKKAMGPTQANVGTSIEAVYEALEKLSRTARYSTEEQITAAHVRKAASQASRLRQWAVPKLTAEGYACAPTTPSSP